MEDGRPHRRRDGEHRRDGGGERSSRSSKSSHKDRDGVRYLPGSEASTAASSRSERKHGEGREARVSHGEGKTSRRDHGDERPERSHRRHGHASSDYREAEYRDLGERADRGDRADRRDRGDRSDKGDRGDRADRSDRLDRGDRGDRRERPDHGERGDGTAGDARPLQIFQRSGRSAPLKILGAGRRGSTEPGARASEGGGGVLGDSAASVPKKKGQIPTASGMEYFAKCRLMDEEWHVCMDEAYPHLLDGNSEFTVVASVGAQGAGKSTVLSLLLASIRGAIGGKRASGKDAPRDRDGNGIGTNADAEPIDSGEEKVPAAPLRLPLDIHQAASFLEGRASAAGVNMCVSTLDRLLLLDAQPLFHYDTTSEVELKSELHFVLFLASICHTLVVVMDTPVDAQLLKFLRLLATLKAKLPDLADWVERRGEGSDYTEKHSGDQRSAAEQHSTPALRESLPRLVVAFNVESRLANAELFRTAQTFLEHSPWNAAPSLHFVRIPTLPGGSLGAMLSSEAAYSAGMRLRECVLCCGPARGRFGKDGTQFTEREWLRDIQRFWEFMQNAPLVHEYFGVLAKGPESYGWPKF